MNKKLKALEPVQRDHNLTFLNHITSARGQRIDEGDTESHSFGFDNMQFWIPSRQSWIHSDQCFIITDTDRDTAMQIFWDKWRSYCVRRFELKYINIENT